MISPIPLDERILTCFSFGVPRPFFFRLRELGELFLPDLRRPEDCYCMTFLHISIQLAPPHSIQVYLIMQYSNDTVGFETAAIRAHYYPSPTPQFTAASYRLLSYLPIEPNIDPLTPYLTYSFLNLTLQISGRFLTKT
jgi:hypothetical protein